MAGRSEWSHRERCATHTREPKLAAPRGAEETEAVGRALPAIAEVLAARADAQTEDPAMLMAHAVSVEPQGYLRDLFCLLPNWPQRRVLELAPAYWKQTLEQAKTHEFLAGNPFRRVALGEIQAHPA